MNEWRNKTCLDCLYRVDRCCQLNPPQLVKGPQWLVTEYPQVFMEEHMERQSYIGDVLVPEKVNKACSKWDEYTEEKGK